MAQQRKTTTTSKPVREKPQQAAQEQAGQVKEKKVATVVTARDLAIDTQRKVSPAAASDWVRALQLGWRQGTVSCLDRSEVSYSRKKPWKQKGTGRARVGSARSPLWRKGGIIFGPQKRTRTLAVSKKVRMGVKNNLLSDYVDNNKVYCLDWESGNVPKTAHAAQALKKMGLVDKKVLLFVTFDDLITRSSWINMPNVTVVLFDEANAVNLLHSDYWIVLKKDFDVFKDMVAQWR